MSPSQASETCASASSATSPWTFEYTNAIKECQDTVPSVFEPARVMTSFLLTRRYLLKKRRGSKATMMTAKPTPRTAPVEATIASVVAVDKPGLSRQADSAPAVTRDHENRTRSTPRTASVEATIASVVAVDKPGLSRQADSAPAVTRDHENRTRSTPRAASVEATVARVVAIDEHVRPSAEPDPPTTSLAESVCWHDPHDRDDRYNQ